MLERAGFPSRTRQRRLNEKRTRLWFEAAGPCPAATDQNSLPGGHSEREPPDPIPNSEVKTLCADGSVPFGHARVGHCQAPKGKPRWVTPAGLFLLPRWWRLLRQGTLVQLSEHATLHLYG